MKLSLGGAVPLTLIPPELIEIYQPVIGFEAMSVWVNLYHALVNGGSVSEQNMLQQMNITQRSFRTSLRTLSKYGLLDGDSKGRKLIPPSVAGLLEQIEKKALEYELERRLLTLLEAFCTRRGQALGYNEADMGCNLVTEKLADEFATRFIKECKFIPGSQLRDRFDMWFEQIQDRRLLEELLERTRHKVAMEGSKGGCPSRYTDKIVRQWLVQGIKSHEDLLRHDQEFQVRCQSYRTVEKELGRAYSTLTPAEKAVIDKWPEKDPDALGALVKSAILSGEYQGKGAPSIAFVDRWLKRGRGKAKADPGNGKFTHRSELSDLEKLVKRKTMVDLEETAHEG